MSPASSHHRFSPCAGNSGVVVPDAQAACGLSAVRGPASPEPWVCGGVSELLRVLAGGASDCGLEAPAPQLLGRVRQDAHLLREGEPACRLYVVRSGSFKCIKTLEDGYEQVLAFAQPGDLLGYEALSLGRQPVSAVALEECSAFALPVSGLQALRQLSAALDCALQWALSRQLVRAGQHAEMMAPVSSEARLARFLLWLSDRMVEQGQSGHRLHLRMGRKDIASLLGVAHETVSRAFSTLSEAGLVEVDNRSVDVLNRKGLQLLARNTRAQAAAETRTKTGAARVVLNPGRACQAAAPQPPAGWCDAMLQQGLLA